MGSFRLSRETEASASSKHFNLLSTEKSLRRRQVMAIVTAITVAALSLKCVYQAANHGKFTRPHYRTVYSLAANFQPV